MDGGSRPVEQTIDRPKRTRRTGSRNPQATAGPKPRKSEATRARIIDAAAITFRDRGYVGTRLSDIATAAGMRAASLYYHFDSREELVEEVILAGSRRVRDAVAARRDALPADHDPVDRIAAMIDAHLSIVLEIGPISSASSQLIWQVPERLRRRTLEVQRAYGAMWRDALEEARRSGALRDDIDLSAARMAILGALNWAADWYRPSGLSPSRLARDIAEMVLNGLRAGPVTGAPTDRPKPGNGRRRRGETHEPVSEDRP